MLFVRFWPSVPPVPAIDEGPILQSGSRSVNKREEGYHTPYLMPHQKSIRCYIHLRTLFLYSRYGSPNIFSSFCSSPGIMKNSINATKIMGNARVTSVPDNTATPKRIDAIPRYIGLRLRRNGPDVTSDVGSSDGCRVVEFFRSKSQ
jgi:hypothetical protein